MRRVSLLNQPSTAVASTTIALLLLSLFKITTGEHPQSYVICKDMNTHQCLMWPFKKEDALEAKIYYDKQFKCRILDVTNLGKELRRHRLCTSIHVTSAIESNLLLLQETPKVFKRLRRSAGFSSRGRYRGQTQSQYLAIDKGNNKNEGVAEAHSAADSSRATVSGNSGMGQAQSQSMYDPNCNDCLGRNDIEAQTLQRAPGGVLPGTTSFGNGPIRGWGNKASTPGQTGLTPGEISGNAQPPYSKNHNSGTGSQPDITGYNPDGQYGPGGTSEHYSPGNLASHGRQYGPNEINGPGGQYRPLNTGGQLPSGPYEHSISDEKKPGGLYPPSKSGVNDISGTGPLNMLGGLPGEQYIPNGGHGGQNLPGGSDRLFPGQYGKHGNSIPESQYRPDGQVPGGGYITNGNGMQGPDRQFKPSGIEGQIPGGTAAQGSLGPYKSDDIRGNGPDERFGPGGIPTQGVNGQFVHSGNTGQIPDGQDNLRGVNIGPPRPSGTVTQYRPDGTAQGSRGHYGLGNGSGQVLNTQYGTNGMRIQGPAAHYTPRGQDSAYPVQSVYPGKLESYPSRLKWPPVQGPFVGPDGLNYICCVANTNNRPDTGGYVPGQYAPGMSGGPSSGGQYGPGAPGGQYVSGGPEGSVSVGQYSPGTLGGSGSVGQYVPGPAGGSGLSGQYVPGGPGGSEPHGQYSPGTLGGTGSGGQYGPGGQGRSGSGEQYVPGAPGGAGTGGQYVPGAPGGARTGGQYIPGAPGGAGTGGQYGPSLTGGSGPGGPGAPGSVGQYDPGVQYISGRPGGSGSSGQYGPGGQYLPGRPLGSGSGGQYEPGLQGGPGAVGQYSPGLPGVSGTGGAGGSESGGNYGSSAPGGTGPDGQFGSSAPGGIGSGAPGGTGSVGNYGLDSPTGSGLGRRYGPGAPSGIGPGGQFGSGAPGGTGSVGNYGLDSPTGSGLGRRYGPGAPSGIGPGGQFGSGAPGGTGSGALDGTGSVGNYGLGSPSGTGLGGRYGPGAPSGNGPGGQYGPGSGGQYGPGGSESGGQYGQGGPGGSGSGGQYRPGLQGSPGSVGTYGPGRPGVPGTGGQYGISGPEDFGPGGQYSQGTQRGSGSGGNYGLGTPSGTRPSGQYAPGEPGGFGSGGQYGPGGSEGSGSGGQYGPSAPGGAGPGGLYGPSAPGGSGLGGQYGPGGTEGSGGQYRPNSRGGSGPGGQYGPRATGDSGAGGLGSSESGGQTGPGAAGGISLGGQYGPGAPGGSGVGGQYGPGSSNYGPGSAIVSGPGGSYVYGPGHQMGGDNSQIPPQNVIDPNIIADGDDSEAEASVAQAANGTVASASSKGGNDKGRAQTHVTGTYTGGGSFSAQAEITGENKAANSEVSGDKKGASSAAQGSGRNNKSQANVKLGSETGAVITGSQSEGVLHSSNSQVQGSVKGGMADAQARGPGSTSSQAQIGFTPFKEGDKNHDKQKIPFVGGGVATAQANGRTGMSQSQLHGTFKYGITYNGAAQSGASLDKDAVFPNRLSFDKIDVFDEDSKTINVDDINIDNSVHTEDITDLPPETAPEATTDVPFVADIVTDLNKEENSKTSDETYSPHSHSDHHVSNDPLLSTTRAPPVEGRRSFKPNYNNNHDDYAYSTDKEDNLPEDYDDEGYEPDVADQADGEQGYINTSYNEFSRDQDSTHQSLLNPNKKVLEVRQTTGGNTQHILLGNLADHDAEITQRQSERPDEGKVYQPGERIPGTGGYTIPIGFTGSVKSVASKDKTYVVGSKESPSQAQTVSLTPGNGKVKYSYSPYGRNVNPKNLRSLYNSRQDDNNRYVSVSKSVTRDLDSENNIRKQYSHTYYTKSSSCGYFTFTCTMVSSAEGKKRVCKPKIPQNPDGSPVRC